jgi:hypothetical protein
MAEDNVEKRWIEQAAKILGLDISESSTRKENNVDIYCSTVFGDMTRVPSAEFPYHNELDGVQREMEIPEDVDTGFSFNNLVYRTTFFLRATFPSYRLLTTPSTEKCATAVLKKLAGMTRSVEDEIGGKLSQRELNISRW